MSEFEFKSCPVCREQLDQCLQCDSYVVNGERIYYEKLADFGATNDSERRFIKRIQKHRTTAFFHHGKLYIPSRQGRSVPLAIGLQWEAWQEQQSEIDQIKVQLSLQRDRNKALEAELTSSRNYGDQLKVQLIDQGQRFNDQSQKVKDLEHQNEKLKAEKAGFKNLVISLRSEFDLNGGSDQVERQIELLEEALRGES